MKKLIVIILTLELLCSCQKKEDSKLNIHFISDVHYAPSSFYKYEGAFALSNDTSGTFKQIKYQEEIIDAYINEELNNKPDFIIVTGDMVFSGTPEAHKEFVNKFKTLIDNKIKVLVLPGNHDIEVRPFITDGNTAIYEGMLSDKEFLDIYSDFGYKDARNVDKDSLSYSYLLDDSTLLLMLDTIDYHGYTQGKLKQTTLSWIESELEFAKKNNMKVIAAGHHNIHVHNDLFYDGYVIDNRDKLIEMFKKYNVNLYVSGHLHIQSIVKMSNIEEVLNESFTIYPHTYGELIINNNNYSYKAKEVNVSNYYKDSNNNDLKNYDVYGYNFALNNSVNQVKNGLLDLNLTDEEIDELSKAIGELNINYFIGKPTDLKISLDKYSSIIRNYHKSLIESKDINNRSTSGSLK